MAELAEGGNELSKVARVINRQKALEEVRDPTLDACRDISTFIVPRYGKYLSRGETGEQKKKAKYTKIIKNSAGRALKVLKSGMQTGLTNPARPWFRLGFPDPGSPLETDAGYGAVLVSLVGLLASRTMESRQLGRGDSVR